MIFLYYVIGFFFFYITRNTVMQCKNTIIEIVHLMDHLIGKRIKIKKKILLFGNSKNEELLENKKIQKEVVFLKICPSLKGSIRTASQRANTFS